MLSPSDLIRRHTLRALFLLVGILVLTACPPAFSGGLPGPGLWPRVTAGGLLACALLLPAPKKAEKTDNARKREAFMLLASGLLWTALLVPAGWAAATLLTGFIACRGAGCSLKECVLLPVLLCLLLEVGVVHLLEWPLPEGLLPTLLPGN